MAISSSGREGQRTDDRRYLHVDIQIPLVITPNRPHDTRPSVLQHQHTLNLLLTLTMIPALFRTTAFAADGTREWRDDDGPGFSLPEGIDDRAFLDADVIVIPVPGLGVDRFANGTEDAEGG